VDNVVRLGAVDQLGHNMFFGVGSHHAYHVCVCKSGCFVNRRVQISFVLLLPLRFSDTS
jgi:hypothetical protein